MKRTLALLVTVALAACATTRPGVEVRFQEVVKEVQVPCPVTKPQRPGPLARPLPEDPGRLVDVLLAKLKEWAGDGGYGERADDAIETCIKGGGDGRNS